MKFNFKHLPAILLLFCLTSAFAQINPQKDQKKRTDAERLFYAAHKIKEVDEYFATNESDNPNDSTLFCRLFYDKRGNLIKTIEYQPFAAAQKIAHRTTTTLYNYNHKNQLTSESSTADEYLLIRGALKKVSNNGMFDKDETYEYNKNGDVESKNYVSPTIVENPDKNNNIGKKIGNDVFSSKWIMYKKSYIDKYSYDKTDHLLSLTTYNDEGKPVKTSKYIYNDSSQLITNIIYNQISKKETSTIVFSYTKIPTGLLKHIEYYDEHDLITKFEDNEYDSNGNLIKEYETIKMAKRLVLDFKYNDKDQPVESKGGPVNLDNIQSKDIRHDGLSHMFYLYDDDGLLIEIKRDKKVGEEKLQGIQKLVYKKY
jgi:hypothetical protein